MDMVGDKQLVTQLSTQSEGEGHQQGQGLADHEVCSCAGSGDMGGGEKELAGEHATSHAVVIVAGGETADSELDTSKEEAGESSRTRNICGIV